MRYSQAVTFRIPNSVKFADKNTSVDHSLVQKQHDELVQTLRECGLDILECQTQDGSPPSSVYAGDMAVAINGIALICRFRKEMVRSLEIERALSQLSWKVFHCPETLNKKPVFLEASDVLFTGKEIFVGVRKNGTNLEGVMVLGRVFCDLNVIPIPLPDDAHPLTYYVSLAAPGVLAVGNSKESQNIVRAMEHEATFSYRKITVEDEECVGCISVNGRVVFRQDKAEPKFNQLQASGVQLWAHDLSELTKVGAPFSRFYLLLPPVGDRPDSLIVN